jgi:hypothetical protein
LLTSTEVQASGHIVKNIIKLLLIAALIVPSAFAGGSIGWADVKTAISKSDPELVKRIEQHFKVNESGGGVRLGPHFGERQGERIAPYHFGAEDKKTHQRCVLVIQESDDYEYTGRFKFTREDEKEAPQPGEPQDAAQPKKEGP